MIQTGTGTAFDEHEAAVCGLENVNLSTDDSERAHRAVRRVLKITARATSFNEETVGLLFRAFAALEREGNLPATDEVLHAASAAGVTERDIARLEGILLAARYGLQDIGRLRGESPPAAAFSYLTLAETRAVRQALFLLVHGPFCNVSGHPGGSEPFRDVHPLTGFDEKDFETLFAAIDERLERGA